MGEGTIATTLMLLEVISVRSRRANYIETEKRTPSFCLEWPTCGAAIQGKNGRKKLSEESIESNGAFRAHFPFRSLGTVSCGQSIAAPKPERRDGLFVSAGPIAYRINFVDFFLKDCRLSGRQSFRKTLRSLRRLNVISSA